MEFEDDEILRELIARQLAPVSTTRESILATMFPKQRVFAEDGTRLKVALCTRRAGKTYGAASLLFAASDLYPGATIPYIALTRRSAKRIMWPVLRRIKDAHGIEADLLDSSLLIKRPNGAEIECMGADMVNFIDRLRGGAYPVAVIDEAQSFGEHLRELVEDILQPAMLDYNGTIVLIGTPGPTCSGVFYEASQGKGGFSVHKWSVLDNPHIPNAADFIKELKAKKGWTDENPTYRREWLGEWVEDPDALVYKYKRIRNDYAKLPQELDWNRILSLDYGWNDQTAFGITSYNYKSPKVFLEHVEGHSEWIPSQIAARLGQLIERFKPSKIVADTGGLGKSITEEMIRRYGIPVMAAKKTDKQAYIHLMNGDLIDGNYLIHDSLENVKAQMLALQKADDGTEDPNLPNDLCDVALYGYREAKAYAFEPELKPPKTQTEKWEREAEKLLTDDVDRMIEDESTEWWEK